MSIKLWDRLWTLLDDLASCNYEVYVYRINANGKLIKPYLFKDYVYPELIGTLQFNHGAGGFRVIIKNGRKIIFGGNIYIEKPVQLSPTQFS